MISNWFVIYGCKVSENMGIIMKKKELFLLFFYCFLRNFGFAEVTCTRKNKIKTRFSFVLLSFIRNFGFAEVTCTRKNKIKTRFSFVLLSFIRNFAPEKVLCEDGHFVCYPHTGG